MKLETRQSHENDELWTEDLTNSQLLNVVTEIEIGMEREASAQPETRQSDENEDLWGTDFSDSQLLAAVNQIEYQIQRDEDAVLEIHRPAENEDLWGEEDFTNSQLLNSVNGLESQTQLHGDALLQTRQSNENEDLWGDEDFTDSQLLESVTQIEAEMEKDDTKKRRLQRGKAIPAKKSKNSEPADSSRCIFFVEDRFEGASTSDECQPSTSTQTRGSVYIDEHASTLDDHQPSTSSETGRPVSDERESIFMHYVTVILKIKSSSLVS